MKTFITALLLAWGIATLAPPGTARADEAPRAAQDEPSAEAKSLAKKAYEKGMGHYQRDDYDRAIEQFDVGYRLVPQPVFLYNIAQAHRLAGRSERALEYYRRYLRESPDAKNRAEVEGRIDTLDRALAEARAPKLKLPDDTPASEPAPAPLAAPLSPKELRVRTDGGGSKKWPIVVGVVVGAVVVGAGVGLGVYFGTRPAKPTLFEPVMP